MCGIAGIQHFNGEPVRREPLERMVSVLEHRGPDANGVALCGQVGLGHTRLSIIDLAGGAQPMPSADGNLTVTFNGEIFNYIELRQELIALGRHFSTSSDTEVLLQAYAEWGEQCVTRFNGQWAFAIWDARQKKLFLSRDRLGKRPLFYSVVGQSLLFASEIKALFTHPAVPKSIDPIGLDQVFTFWSTLPPRTIFRGIQQLPPGHSLTVERGKLRVARYWDVDFSKRFDGVPSQQLEEQLLDLLTDATRLRLRSDVPVGAYLSGGLDSSITSALAKTCSSHRLSTFSVEFDNAEFDESRFQSEVVHRLGTEHHAVRCTHDDIGRVFPDVIRHAETPILRTAPAPLFLLSRLVRESGIKVVLTGEGADEFLGGYDIFKEAKLRRFWARQSHSTSRPLLLKRLYPYMKNIQSQSAAYLKAFFQVRPQDLASPFFSHLPRWELTSKLKDLFTPEMAAATYDADPLLDAEANLPKSFSSWDGFSQSQYLEATGLLPGYLLSSQGDRVMMGNGIEGRFPFLDHRLVEFAAQLPPRLKMCGLNEKHLLKQATKHLVPESIRNRTKQPYRAPDALSFFDTDAGTARFEYVDALFAPFDEFPFATEGARSAFIAHILTEAARPALDKVPIFFYTANYAGSETCGGEMGLAAAQGDGCSFHDDFPERCFNQGMQAPRASSQGDGHGAQALQHGVGQARKFAAGLHQDFACDGIGVGAGSDRERQPTDVAAGALINEFARVRPIVAADLGEHFFGHDRGAPASRLAILAAPDASQGLVGDPVAAAGIVQQGAASTGALQAAVRGEMRSDGAGAGVNDNSPAGRKQFQANEFDIAFQSYRLRR